jgi:hypothetical protein
MPSSKRAGIPGSTTESTGMLAQRLRESQPHLTDIRGALSLGLHSEHQCNTRMRLERVKNQS